MSAILFENKRDPTRSIPRVDIEQAPLWKNFDARQTLAPPRHTSLVECKRNRRTFVGQMLLLMCGAGLVCGFIYAATQKFAAVRYGYRYEALRQERERLLAEQRRLTFELDKISSPSRLEKAAKDAGLDVASAAQIHAPKAYAPPSKPIAAKVHNDIHLSIAKVHSNVQSNTTKVGSGIESSGLMMTSAASRR